MFFFFTDHGIRRSTRIRKPTLRYWDFEQVDTTQVNEGKLCFVRKIKTYTADTVVLERGVLRRIGRTGSTPPEELVHSEKSQASSDGQNNPFLESAGHIEKLINFKTDKTSRNRLTNRNEKENVINVCEQQFKKPFPVPRKGRGGKKRSFPLPNKTPSIESCNDSISAEKVVGKTAESAVTAIVTRSKSVPKSSQKLISPSECKKRKYLRKASVLPHRTSKLAKGSKRQSGDKRKATHTKLKPSPSPPYTSHSRGVCYYFIET